MFTVVVRTKPTEVRDRSNGELPRQSARDDIREMEFLFLTDHGATDMDRVSLYNATHTYHNLIETVRYSAQNIQGGSLCSRPRGEDVRLSHRPRTHRGGRFVQGQQKW